MAILNNNGLSRFVSNLDKISAYYKTEVYPKTEIDTKSEVDEKFDSCYLAGKELTDTITSYTYKISPKVWTKLANIPSNATIIDVAYSLGVYLISCYIVDESENKTYYLYYSYDGFSWETFYNSTVEGSYKLLGIDIDDTYYCAVFLCLTTPSDYLIIDIGIHDFLYVSYSEYSFYGFVVNNISTLLYVKSLNKVYLNFNGKIAIGEVTDGIFIDFYLAEPNISVYNLQYDEEASSFYATSEYSRIYKSSTTLSWTLFVDIDSTIDNTQGSIMRIDNYSHVMAIFIWYGGRGVNKPATLYMNQGSDSTNFVLCDNYLSSESINNLNSHPIDLVFYMNKIIYGQAINSYLEFVRTDFRAKYYGNDNWINIAIPDLASSTIDPYIKVANGLFVTSTGYYSMTNVTSFNDITLKL